ncbi:hypothetical protein MA20_07090 [Bradyrhizobium japonicum]|uniref:Uncharacterized protein n=1 Tax=Bradyrhizobium japonicum TaxID=375 RepID=A0A0A3Y4Q4_BRAJP|nr:hypothetical protein [Bradyrhizobium japonicum]KGT80366.1 hypothetical protein MA20_07090 [Bradyrhizobium japonicum]MCS3898646.1 hypothetical protein [Bradyrhizobium japonicum USDA 38]MCS3941699.1 hypothetical protein [Bradyrhizobium japonicum]MCW2225814.1 hypothetical protein [Bradyrhizobium japonicum]MCW2341025.1 hypothetical protein [Bradyrhizobium japonicum]
MKISLATLPTAALAFTLMISAPPALACNGNGNCENAPGQVKKFEGAPGPIAGAGLPMLAIGYGVYWLVKRRRKVD